MHEKDEPFSAMDGFRQTDEMVFGKGPPRQPPIDPPIEKSDNSGMDPLADLTTRMGRVETGIEGLRHSQNILAGILAGGLALILAIVVYFAQDVGDQVRDMNARFDRFLERQADTAAAANARFDRLLEQRATQGPTPNPAPIIIQMPGPVPVTPRNEETPPQPR